MPAKKGEKRAKGRGAVQLKKRDPAEYYQVGAARFNVKNDTGQRFQTWKDTYQASYAEIITVIVEFPYIQAAILREIGKV